MRLRTKRKPESRVLLSRLASTVSFATSVGRKPPYVIVVAT